MNTVSSYRIRSVSESLIKDRLLTIFKDRWFTENQNEWISNSKNGKVLKSIYPKSTKSAIIFSDKISTFNDFDENNKSLLERGKIELLDFPIIAHILLNTTYKKVNEQLKLSQNKVIQSICEFYKNAFDSYFFFNIHDQDDVQGIQEQKIFTNLETIKGLLIELEQTIDKSKKEPTKFKNINEEIDYKLNTLQDSKMEITENDKKATELKDKGNKSFSLEKYEEAENYYTTALEIEDLTNYTKSILFSNLSKTYLQMTNNERAYKLSNKNLAQKAHINATYAAINRPSWSTVYFILSKSLYKINAIEDSARHSIAAYYLEPNSNELKLYSDRLIKYVNDRHKISIENHGKRDYEAEARLRIIELGNLIETKYGNKKLTKEWCESIDPSTRKYIDESRLSGIPLSRYYENHFFKLATIAYNSNQDEKAIEYFSRCISNGIDLSMAYNLLGLMYSDKIYYNLKKNKSLLPLILSLFLKGSLLPISSIYGPPNNTLNYNIMLVWSELGRIYKNGLYEEPIDLKKSKYYLKSAIKLNRGEKDYNSLNNMAFHHLGQLYLNESKTEKGKKLLFKGAELGDPHCYHILMTEFSNNNDVHTFLTNPNIKFNKSVYLEYSN